jgi:metal-dependent amidase/aminoacylase/carboxypeptidase family protein
VIATRRSVAASAGTVLAMLLEAVGQEVPTAVALRRELHASPELGGYEIRTASRVAAALGESGVPSATTGPPGIARVHGCHRVYEAGEPSQRSQCEK